MPAALAIFAILVVAPAIAFAQDLAGVVVSLRGKASVAHEQSPAPRPVAVNDDILVGDRIATGEGTDVYILLSPTARARLARASDLAVVLQPSLHLGPESAATLLAASGTASVVLESGSVGGYRRWTPASTPLSIRTPNAIGQTTGWVSVSFDPHTPQVADGSLVALTTICGGSGATSGGAIDGGMRELKSGECISVVDDVSGSVEWRFSTPTEHWKLLRRLVGTGRWLHHDSFPTREDCRAAAERQRGLGRRVECRFQTGWPGRGSHSG